jgi:hypothetical protein
MNWMWCFVINATGFTPGGGVILARWREIALTDEKK